GCGGGDGRGGGWGGGEGSGPRGCGGERPRPPAGASLAGGVGAERTPRHPPPMPGFAERTAIAGVAETDYVRGADKLPVEMLPDVGRETVADAGLTFADIDGLIPQPGY